MKWKFCFFLVAFSIGLIYAQEVVIKKDADLFKKDVAVVFINGEFLYWTASEGALDYALSMNNAAWGPNNVYACGDYKLAKFDWDPGFRVSLGYFNAPKYYNVVGEYTSMQIKNSNSSSKPATADHYLTGTFPQIITIVSRAHSHIKLNYDLANLFVSRVFITNPHLKLCIVGGLSAVIIKQKWNVKYYDSLNHITNIKNKWRYFGGGARLGATFDWFWGNDFYLTAKSAAGLYVGRYKNESIEKTTLSLGAGYDTNIPFKDSKYKHYRPAFTAQIILGPSWQKNFSSNRVEIFAGYEVNGWFNLQEIYRSSFGVPSINKDTFVNKATLAMHGFTFRMRVDF